MIGNGIRHTSATGGTGALTLSSISGWPSFTNLFGTSGTRIVRYQINQYTDSTHATLAQFEEGIGTLTLSTNSLARTQVNSTWDGTTYLPNWSSSTAPTALSFSATSNLVDVICSPAPGTMLPPPAFVAPAISSVTSGVGAPPVGVLQSAITYTLNGGTSTGVFFAWPVLLQHPNQISKVSIIVTTAQTGTSAYFALYENTSSGIGNPVANWGNIGATTSATVVTSSALAQPVQLWGWYWAGILCYGNASNVAVRGHTLLVGPQGYLTSSASGAACWSLSAQTALPASAPTMTGNNGVASAYCPLVLFQ